jgi:hypothetical protein
LTEEHRDRSRRSPTTIPTRKCATRQKRVLRGETIEPPEIHLDDDE